MIGLGEWRDEKQIKYIQNYSVFLCLHLIQNDQEVVIYKTLSLRPKRMDIVAWRCHLVSGWRSTDGKCPQLRRKKRLKLKFLCVMSYTNNTSNEEFESKDVTWITNFRFLKTKSLSTRMIELDHVLYISDTFTKRVMRISLGIVKDDCLHRQFDHPRLLLNNEFNVSLFRKCVMRL